MSAELKRKLKAAREKLSYSQSKMAAHLGVPIKTLQHWEADRMTPRGFALKALEEALDKIIAS